MIRLIMTEQIHIKMWTRSSTFKFLCVTIRMMFGIIISDAYYIFWRFTPGSLVRGIDSTFGSGSGSITLDNVVCAGTEDNLLSCSHNQIFQHNCDHSEDVAVICDGELIIKYY